MPIQATYSYDRRFNLGHRLDILQTVRPGERIEYGAVGASMSLAKNLGLQVVAYCDIDDRFGEVYYPHSSGVRHFQPLSTHRPSAMLTDFRPVRMPFLANPGCLILEFVNEDAPPEPEDVLILGDSPNPVPDLANKI